MKDLIKLSLITLTLLTGCSSVVKETKVENPNKIILSSFKEWKADNIGFITEQEIDTLNFKKSQR